MKFKTRINGRSDRNWSVVNCNTCVSDEFVASQSNFHPRASSKTIIKEYLKSYGIEPMEDGTYNFTAKSFDVRIEWKSGSQMWERFSVAVHPCGKWATVTGGVE